jgi:tRNA U34 5-methylaminomethyl-2-thiouridine-forming methyltransferase MnmC
MYKEEQTADGSITYRSPDVDETYHSHSGALNEALQKYVLPSGIANSTGDVTVLDVCYGLGYNSFVALAWWLEHKEDMIHFICLENDPKIIELGTQVKLAKLLQYPQQFFKEVAAHPGVLTQAPRCSGILHLDDMRKQLPKLESNSVDYCFFDPFSPGKVPELWAKEIFVELFRIMKPGGALTTYSCARLARDGMRHAGFEVLDGPTIGRRSPSTIAKKN